MQKIEGNIVDVVSKTIKKGVLTIENGKISEIEYKDVDSTNFIIPGFIDAHVHVESSMLIPSEFARLAVLHGTVATISDPHEIGNVLGKDGVKFMIENGKNTPFKFYFGAPSCVPATQFETAGATISPKDIEEILSWEGVNYLAEMMNYPGVVFQDADVMEKIAIAKRLGKVIDGHLPGIRGEWVQKYVAAGISTDHECFGLEEALEKIALGMKIIIREGSAAKNFEALWTLIDRFPEMVMFCSDDKHPNDLVVSHINAVAKRAIEKGCDLFNVLRACSKNVVEHYSMNVGLLQKNDPADFCVVKDLTNFEVIQTFIDGKLVAKNQKTFIESVEITPVNNFSCKEITKEQLQIKAESNVVKVIVVENGQLITKQENHSVTDENGFLLSDVEKDILKIVVVNRYFSAEPAVAFVKNFGLKEGAIASCVAHDSHNIIAVGVDDEALVKAINLIIMEKGGVSLSSDEMAMVVSLPVAGIMSHKDAYVIADEYSRIDAEAKRLGSTLNAPYMTLSFCALLVIPELKLSDKGLFDGKDFKFVSLYN
ncbi:MAG: adenine deaminase [Bacteroidota bacterium]